MKYFWVTMSVLLIAGAIGCESDDESQAADGTTEVSDTTQQDTSQADVTPVDTATADTSSDTSVDTSTADTSTDTSSSDTATADMTTADTTTPDTTTDTSTPACSGNSECTWCLYPTAPSSVDECYCAVCPTDVLDTTTCEANASAWFTMCDDWSSSCPVAKCLQNPEAICSGDTCVSECALVDCLPLDCPVDEQFTEPGTCCPQCPVDPAICEDNDDCRRCSYKQPVETVEDCYCTLCPSHATTNAQCETWGQQWQDTCNGTWTDENPCPVAICLPGAPTTCVDGTCGGCDQVTCEIPDCAEHLQFTAEGECCAQCPPDPTPCSEDGDCTFCPYKRAVNSPAECYCTLCSSFGVTSEQCTEWGNQWNTHCTGNWANTNPCPVAICLPPPSAVCDDAGACVQDPYSCTSDGQCGTCTHTEAPTSSAECKCPVCPTPMSNAECTDITAAVATHCSGGELDDCLPLPCVKPPPTACDVITHECGFLTQ